MNRALLVVLLLFPALAVAQEPAPTAEARRFYDAGVQAYDDGQYAVAITALEEALRLDGRPGVVQALAQAYRVQYFVDRDPAKLKRAVELFHRYVDEFPKGKKRGEAVQALSELEPILLRLGPVQSVAPAPQATQLMVSSRTKGATARIDAGEGGDAPVIVDVQPGKHTIVVEAEGHYPETVDGVAVEGRLVAVEVTLRPRPAVLAVTSEAGAEIAIDGRPVGQTPLTRPLELPAGRHFLSVSRRGRRVFTREVVLARGQTLTLDAPLETTTQRRASVWVLGAAGAAFLVGAGTTTMAFVHQGEAEDLLARRDAGGFSEAERADYNRERELRDDYRTASYLAFGAAGALAATGALLFFIDTPRVEGAPAPALVPVVGPESVGLAYGRRF